MIRHYTETVPAWMQQIERLPLGCHGARGGPLCDGIDLARLAYGDAADDPGTQFTAFAYCWRRFGPPWLGGDPHKELVSYALGTPSPGLMLALSLSASPLPYAVGYLISSALDDTLSAPRRAWDAKFHHWWSTRHATTAERVTLDADTRFDAATLRAATAALGPIPRHYAAAASASAQASLIEALTELLRPVFVKDVPINILGRIPAANLDERDTAEVSPYAGYGIPKDAMDALVRDDE